MRAGVLLAIFLVLGWSTVAAAQVSGGGTVSRRGGILGTSVGAGAGAAGVQGGAPVRGSARARSPLVTQGVGHIGSGTGGTGRGVGNASGGIEDRASGAGTGGVGDLTTAGSSLGGVVGVGRGQGVGSGGLADSLGLGVLTSSTGGVSDSAIGAGTGGLGDSNSFGAGTGGIGEGNAQRFRSAR